MSRTPCRDLDRLDRRQQVGPSSGLRRGCTREPKACSPRDPPSIVEPAYPWQQTRIRPCMADGYGARGLIEEAGTQSRTGDAHVDGCRCEAFRGHCGPQRLDQPGVRRSSGTEFDDTVEAPPRSWRTAALIQGRGRQALGGQSTTACPEEQERCEDRRTCHRKEAVPGPNPGRLIAPVSRPAPAKPHERSG